MTDNKPQPFNPIEFPTLVKYDSQQIEDAIQKLMITHNMKDAINHGTRLIMMNEGHIILDVEGEEKKKLTKQQLMEKFAEIAGKQVESDRILLS